MDEGETVGDSDGIVAHLIAKHRLPIDLDLTPAQRTLDHLVAADARRPRLGHVLLALARPALLADLPRRDPRGAPRRSTAGELEAARAYNAKRYHYQGIGRYEPEGVYERGLADLAALAGLLGAGFLFGDRPHGADAGRYGFLANIHFYRIETPLRAFIGAHPGLGRYCEAMHAAVTDASPPATGRG